MDKSLRDQLDAAFQKDRERVVTAEQKTDAALEERKKFFADFMRVRDEIIRPAMQEFADYIADKGWKCEIKSVEERENPRGGTDNAGITMYFFRGSPPNYYEDHKYPHWAVRCDKMGKKFQFFDSTIGPNHGGSGGGAGSATLEQISVGFIQSEIGKYIPRLMKDAAPYGSR